MSLFLKELRKKALHAGMNEIPDQIDLILESVLYSNALPVYAIEELNSMWGEVEEAHDLMMEIPTLHELKALHPLMA